MGPRFTVAFALLLAVAVPGGSACAKRKSANEEPATAGATDRRLEENRATPTEPSAATVPAEGGDRHETGTELGSDAPPAGDPAQSAQRMIVYHASLRLGVHAVEETLAAIDAVAVRQGGYVDSGTLSRRVLRIPVANYQVAVDELRALGEVRDFRQSSWNVTEKYQNIEARLDNLRMLRQRYLLLLAQAATMDERLAVEKELRRIELELRVLEEERRLLADEAAFATITVDVEAIHVEPVVKDRRPQPFGWVRSYGLARLLAR